MWNHPFLPPEVTEELQWWVSHILHVHAEQHMIIESDASKKGWGAVFGGEEIGGRWIASESSKHINILELD